VSAEAKTFWVSDECDTWTEEGDSADEVADMLLGRSRAEAGYDPDMPVRDLTYEIRNIPMGDILRTVTVSYPDEGTGWHDKPGDLCPRCKRGTLGLSGTLDDRGEHICDQLDCSLCDYCEGGLAI
jgi:hypothetical protein